MRVRLGLALLAALIPFTGASAARVHVVHAFAGGDGSNPQGALVPGPGGVLYGTAATGGGLGHCGYGHAGCGTVFSLARDGTLSVLHTFGAKGDGLFPTALVRDGAGNLYGVTALGGLSKEDCTLDHGCGTLFKIAPDGTETVLHSFQGGTDGALPNAVTIDASGNLYGLTGSGGFDAHDPGYGTVFEMTADGAYSILYAFQGDVTGGQYPLGNLARDGAGNLYGTVSDPNTHHGMVFKLTPGGVQSTLYAFGAPPDGDGPRAGVIIDGAGNLYGTTASGGVFGKGTVFKIDAAGNESILYSFGSFDSGLSDGMPNSGVILDRAGNLYGTTPMGGTGDGCGDDGCGVIYRIAPDGTETTLVSLTARDGGNPAGSLYRDGHGVLFGTAQAGGANGAGTVFRLRGP